MVKHFLLQVSAMLLVMVSFIGSGHCRHPLPAHEIPSPPLAFISNQGQYPSAVRYAAHTAGESFFFTGGGIMILLKDVPASMPTTVSLPRRQPNEETEPAWAIRLAFLDANPNPDITGKDKLPTLFNWYRGAQESWRSGISSFGGLVYQDLWPGIDLHLTSSTDQLKYTFVVRPGADPQRIRLAYEGAGLELQDDGSLSIQTPLGTLRDQVPLCWQVHGDRKVEIASAYQVASLGPARGMYGFRLAAYDSSLPLIIDPGITVYSGLLGGSAQDSGFDVAVDDAGRMHIAGVTTSSDFPFTVGSYSANVDIFVARLSPDGTEVEYCSVIGDTSFDFVQAIALDADGNSYITGSSESPDYPRVPTGIGSSHQGGEDIVVTKLDATGAIVYSRFLGGSGEDQGRGIAVDQTGSVYIGGETLSDDYPRVPAYLPGRYGAKDMVVTKLSANGQSIVYSGYLGGTAIENGGAIAVDGSGCAYVAGSSTSVDYPRKPSGNGRPYQGGRDMVLTKINATGTDLEYSGYLGGSAYDSALDVDVDAAGQAHIIGITTSTDIPTTVGRDNQGGGDILVAKINAAGTTPLFLGLLGGTGEDNGRAIEVDAQGYVYIVGDTDSTDFPRTGGQPLQDSFDAFISKIAPDGTALAYSVLLGGSDREQSSGMAIDAAGSVYLVGTSVSANFPSSVGRPFQGVYDAFFARIKPDPDFQWPMFLPASAHRPKIP